VSLHPNVIVEALKYLQSHGFTEPQLSKIHHLERPEKYERSIAYFSKVSFVRGNNERYGHRLRHVMKGHQKGEASYPQLIENALGKWPLSG
jgi:hypothetical protein